MIILGLRIITNGQRGLNIFKSCNHDARGYPLLVSHLVNPC